MSRAFVLSLGLLLGVSASVRADDGEGYLVTLGPALPGTKLDPQFRPAFSEAALARLPKGAMQGFHHLGARIPIGPDPGPGREVVLLKSRADQPYDILLIDRNGDGTLAGDTPVRAVLKGTNTARTSAFDVSLRVAHGTADSQTWQEHALYMWVVSRKDAQPETLWYHSKGFRRGGVQIGVYDFYVVLADSNNDASYGKGDLWTIRLADNKRPYEYKDARKLGEFAWGAKKPWKFALTDTTGKEGRVRPFKTKITQQQDERKRDPYWRDREGPRAEQPLAFSTNVKDAIRMARDKNAPYLVLFDSRHCMDCATMDQLVYTSREAVAAASGLVAIRVPDSSPTAAKWRNTYGVKEGVTPTGVLFDPDSNEVARFKGYLGSKDFVALMGEVNSWLLPAAYEPRKLKGKAKKRHARQIKIHHAYLESGQSGSPLLARITEVGHRKTRSARDALMYFAEKRKSKEYVVAAFDALARIGGAVAVEFLCGKHALQSGDFLVAKKAAEALAIAADPASAKPILEVMIKPGTKIQIVAECAMALAKTAPTDEDALFHLFRFSHHRKDTIRSSVAEALGYLRSDEAVERLKVMLTSDKNTRVRESAARGMGHTKRPELIPFIRQAVDKDKAFTVKDAGSWAIQELQRGS